MYNTGEQPKYTERKSNKNSFPLLPKLTAVDLLVKLDFHCNITSYSYVYNGDERAICSMYILSIPEMKPLEIDRHVLYSVCIHTYPKLSMHHARESKFRSRRCVCYGAGLLAEGRDLLGAI
jgi:hypothetical protein